MQSHQYKYQPLENHLKTGGLPEIPMTFEEIEAIIQDRLPSSARKHRPWWSNNPSNSVMTKSWLAAGYKTAQVNMESECLVFVRDDTSNFRQTSSPATSNGSTGHPVLGCMTGTVTVTVDLDLTAPAMPEWAEMSQNTVTQT